MLPCRERIQVTIVDYRYVIVGGGMAADAAVKAVRRADPTGNTLLVSAEPDPPYRRPPLSKGLWSGDDPQKIFLGTAATGATERLSATITELDAAAKSITLADGSVIAYERLLLATGARPKVLPQLSVSGPVITYRTLADFHEAKRRSGPGKRVLVVGGGFVGSELAAGLQRAGSDVHMAFREEAISALRFPSELAEIVTEDYRRRGVKVHPGTLAEDLMHSGDAVVVRLSDGTQERFDLVVVGAGTVPNDELAAEAGLRVGDGVVVDEFLRAHFAERGDDSDPHSVVKGVYAAGDVANFPWVSPVGRGRIEHEDNAVVMGGHAGRQMAASWLQEHEPANRRPQEEPYDHLPFFYSDLFDNGYEAVGVLDAQLETFSDWRKHGEEGVIYYLRDGLVVGVLLWNTWGQVDEARDLLLAAQQVDSAELRGRLPR